MNCRAKQAARHNGHLSSGAQRRQQKKLWLKKKRLMGRFNGMTSTAALVDPPCEAQSWYPDLPPQRANCLLAQHRRYWTTDVCLATWPASLHGDWLDRDPEHIYSAGSARRHGLLLYFDPGRPPPMAMPLHTEEGLSVPKKRHKGMIQTSCGNGNTCHICMGSTTTCSMEAVEVTDTRHQIPYLVF